MVIVQQGVCQLEEVHSAKSVSKKLLLNPGAHFPVNLSTHLLDPNR